MARENAQDVIERYRRAQQLRQPRENQFRLNAAYCLPRDYEYWMTAESGGQMNGTDAEHRARFAFDNTGVRAVPKYMAICKRLINPDGIKYHTLECDNDELNKMPAVRMFFSDLTSKLFKMRADFRARFGTAQGENYASIGVYGSGIKTTLWRPGEDREDVGGFMYKAWPMYDIFFLVDDMGRLTDVFRRFRLTRRMFELKWPDEPLPKALANVQPGDVTTRAEFAHVVSKRKGDYDPKALDAKRHPWQACYVAVTDATYIGDESGFVSNPYQISSTMSVAGDPYGYSPAELAFPALGGANAIKKTYLKMGHKAVDPTLLVNDDGVLSGRLDLRPGRAMYGGLDAQGREMVKPLMTGSNFQVAENILADERNDINDSFLVSLFTILTETPEMTAAEVYERVAEKAALFAPTMAALQELDQGPQIERELALLAEHGQFPQPPPELVEAKAGYKINYTNPMNKALYASEVSGFMRWSQMLVEAANASQDPSALDHINWDAAAPEIADKMDVRPHWVNTPEDVKARREARAQQQQQQQMVEAAPAAASMVATMQKQGAAR